jgi:hypothetical protein
MLFVTSTPRQFLELLLPSKSSTYTDCFRRFCTSRQEHEILEFWYQVQRLQTAPAIEFRKEANMIFNNFIGSRKLHCITTNMRAKVETRLNTLTKNITVKIYNECHRAVFQYLYTRSYSSFLEQDEGKR